LLIYRRIYSSWEKFPTNANVYLGKLTLFIVRYHLSQKKNQTLALHVLCLELLVNHNFVSLQLDATFPEPEFPPYGQGSFKSEI
ncbi:hypothetical protein, partial [Klebsiella pneumoniae]